MNITTKTLRTVAAGSALLLAVAGCSQPAEVASKNLSKGADNFEIERRIVFFNGITDKYLLVIEGKCSIEPDGGKLDVTCKTGEDEFKKHFLGLSDNVSYFVQQVEGEDVSAYRYRVVFRPSTVVPDPEIDMGGR